MSRKIFISYNYKDRQLAHQVIDFFQPQGGQCQGSAAFVKENVAEQGDAAIDAAIKDVMTPCVGVLFVVGDNNHNSPWIDREAELAVSRNLGMVLVQLPDTTGGVPNRLKDLPVVEWKSHALCDALNKIPQPKSS